MSQRWRPPVLDDLWQIRQSSERQRQVRPVQCSRLWSIFGKYQREVSENGSCTKRIYQRLCTEAWISAAMLPALIKTQALYCQNKKMSWRVLEELFNMTFRKIFFLHSHPWVPLYWEQPLFVLRHISSQFIVSLIKNSNSLAPAPVIEL